MPSVIGNRHRSNPVVATPYAPDKLIAQARSLAAEYRRAMGKPLPGVSSEIAEHDAIRLLALEPRPEGEAGGWDARDPRSGERFQIKSRLIAADSRGGERIGQLKLNQSWDAVLLVLMDEDYQPQEIWRARRDDLLEYIDSGSARARRGAMSVARFRVFGELVWDAVGGRAEDGED